MGQHAVIPTDNPCVSCGANLLRLSPPVLGWEHYCIGEELLTEPRAVLAASWDGMREIEPTMTYMVYGVPTKLRFYGAGCYLLPPRGL